MYIIYTNGLANVVELDGRNQATPIEIYTAGEFTLNFLRDLRPYCTIGTTSYALLHSGESGAAQAKCDFIDALSSLPGMHEFISLHAHTDSDWINIATAAYQKLNAKYILDPRFTAASAEEKAALSYLFESDFDPDEKLSVPAGDWIAEFEAELDAEYRATHNVWQYKTELCFYHGEPVGAYYIDSLDTYLRLDFFLGFCASSSPICRCPVCGEFFKSAKNQIYCSNKCKTAAKREKLQANEAKEYYECYRSGYKNASNLIAGEGSKSKRELYQEYLAKTRKLYDAQVQKFSKLKEYNEWNPDGIPVSLSSAKHNPEGPMPLAVFQKEIHKIWAEYRHKLKNL